MRPNVPKTGNLKAFTGGIETYFYLHQSEYREVEVAVQRVNEKDPNVVLYVSTSPHASITNHFWTDSTQADSRAEIELTHDHPQFCTDCYYYIGIYYMDEVQEDDDTELTVSVNCPDNVCLTCDKEGLDPAKSCKECLPGYYGEDCQLCPDCNHGTCSDGKQGSGQCLCDDGWGPEGKCNDCIENHYGLQCLACESCNGHGICDAGLKGTGECKCDTNFDSRTRCENCAHGYFGLTCEGECLKTANGVCDNHGLCDDGMTGDGHCKCENGRVGLKCDTEYDKDACNPHCNSEGGGCDEEKGVCVCYDGYSGKDCSGSSNIWITISISLMLVIIIIVVIFVVMKVSALGKVKQRRTPKTNSHKESLLSNPDDIYSGLN